MLTSAVSQYASLLCVYFVVVAVRTANADAVPFVAAYCFCFLC